LPTVFDPGSTGRSSSSRTTVSRIAVTLGPRVDSSPDWTRVYPFEPLSDAPIASVRITLGSRSRKRSLTVGENTAAVLEIDTSDERSWSAPASSRASTRGRPIASPVIMIPLIRSSPTSCHTRLGSKRARRTILLPWNAPPITPHWVAPCINGAMGSIVPGWRSWARATSASGRSTRVLVVGSIPPPRAKKTSSWRHTTPFGIPVVPPV